VAQAHINDGLEFLRLNYIVPRDSLQLNFSHALFNPIKFAVLLIDRVLNYGGARGPAQHEIWLVDTTLRIYTISAALAGIALYFGRIRKLPMLNQVVALTTCAVLLTPYSSDYTLNHLLIPFGLMSFYAVEAWHAQRRVPGLETAFACCCIAFGFETFFMWKYPFSSAFRTLSLVVLLITMLRFPMRWTALDGPEPMEAGL